MCQSLCAKTVVKGVKKGSCSLRTTGSGPVFVSSCPISNVTLFWLTVASQQPAHCIVGFVGQGAMGRQSWAQSSDLLLKEESKLGTGRGAPLWPLCGSLELVWGHLWSSCVSANLLCGGRRTGICSFPPLLAPQRSRLWHLPTSQS